MTIDEHTDTNETINTKRTRTKLGGVWNSYKDQTESSLLWRRPKLSFVHWIPHARPWLIWWWLKILVVVVVVVVVIVVVAKDMGHYY